MRVVEVHSCNRTVPQALSFEMYSSLWSAAVGVTWHVQLGTLEMYSWEWLDIYSWDDLKCTAGGDFECTAVTVMWLWDYLTVYNSRDRTVTKSVSECTSFTLVQVWECKCVVSYRNNHYSVDWMHFAQFTHVPFFSWSAALRFCFNASSRNAINFFK